MNSPLRLLIVSVSRELDTLSWKRENQQCSILETLTWTVWELSVLRESDVPPNSQLTHLAVLVLLAAGDDLHTELPHHEPNKQNLDHQHPNYDSKPCSVDSLESSPQPMRHQEQNLTRHLDHNDGAKMKNFLRKSTTKVPVEPNSWTSWPELVSWTVDQNTHTHTPLQIRFSIMKLPSKLSSNGSDDARARGWQVWKV